MTVKLINISLSSHGIVGSYTNSNSTWGTSVDMRATFRTLYFSVSSVLTWKYNQSLWFELLSYWDWTLDWQDISASSIWSNEDGFGGENDCSIDMRGDTSDNTCVSGPFKDNVFINFNGTIWPHCLSRQLQNTTSERGKLAKELIRPEAMGQLTRSQNYGTLRYMIEMQMHNVIHYGIIGDLTEVSSANGRLSSRRKKSRFPQDDKLLT